MGRVALDDPNFYTDPLLEPSDAASDIASVRDSEAAVVYAIE